MKFLGWLGKTLVLALVVYISSFAAGVLAGFLT